MRKLIPVLVGFVSCLILACGPKGVSVNDSGGEPTRLTPDSVRQLFYEVRSDLGRIRLSNVLVMAYLEARNIRNRNAEEETTRSILRKILSIEYQHPAPLNDILASASYIRDIRIADEFREPCRIRPKTRKGPICFSVSDLARYSSLTPYNAATVLFVTQLAEANGATELEAERVAKFLKVRIANYRHLASTSAEDQKLTYLSELWHDLLAHWPMIIRYDSVDANYVRLLARFGFWIARLEGESKPPYNLTQTAARPELSQVFYNRVFSLSEELKLFAEETDEALEKADSEITEVRLLRMKRLAMGIIELYELLSTYLFGDNPPIRSLSKNPLPLSARERFWIEKATRPELLKDWNQAPELLCREEIPPTDKARTRRTKILEEPSTRPQKRCSPGLDDEEKNELKYYEDRE